jgi:hypothetical protein
MERDGTLAMAIFAAGSSFAYRNLTGSRINERMISHCPALIISADWAPTKRKKNSRKGELDPTLF